MTDKEFVNKGIFDIEDIERLLRLAKKAVGEHLSE